MLSKLVFRGGLLCLFANCAFGQTSVPMITAVENFAGQTNFSPGAYAFAYATNLGAQPTVTVNQAQAQVLSITPSYVSFQIPRTASLGTGSVVIQNSAGSSTPFMVPINATSPAIVFNDAAPPVAYFF